MPDLVIAEGSEQELELGLEISAAAQADAKLGALKQNITTLRNRVNELGVAEPIIQQQGTERIVVQLPGVQDTARAKEILVQLRLLNLEWWMKKMMSRLQFNQEKRLQAQKFISLKMAGPPSERLMLLPLVKT